MAANERKSLGVRRRQLLADAVRWTALLAVAGICATLAGRLFRLADGGAGEPVAGQDGSVAGPGGLGNQASSRCGQCPSFGGCLLPEADVARRTGLGLIGTVRLVRRERPGQGRLSPGDPLPADMPPPSGICEQLQD